MTQDPSTEGRAAGRTNDHRTTRFLGSLKDALAAASREDAGADEARSRRVDSLDHHPAPPIQGAVVQHDTAQNASRDHATSGTGATPGAATAARASRGTSKPLEEQDIKLHKLPTTRVVKSSELKASAPRTQLVRGKLKVERGEFEQDPVVGWVVVVGGPGIGSYRPIFEGNNSVGRGKSNRIAIEFGDETISSEEQAYIRYDSSDRSFLFVPNLAKTNVVSVNNEKPTGAVTLNQMDVIMMGRTQLVFVPFCGSEFDWSALGETTKG